MSHDTEAAYAASEIADTIMKSQNAFFGDWGTRERWFVCAMREGGHRWPLADAVILAENVAHDPVRIAFEYKRPNEGLHGVLTAIGQSFAYLEKGYSAAVMVIPAKYQSHSTPGDYLKRVIDATAPQIPISVYTYVEPNLSAVRPFADRLQCVRSISLPSCRAPRVSSISQITEQVSTLWAHMREGMSHPDAFFRFCQAVKIVTAMGECLGDVQIPSELSAAVGRISSGADAFKYLSHTSGDTVSDRAWRHVWFHWYFWNSLMPLYRKKAPGDQFAVNDARTRISLGDTRGFEGLFAGRRDSVKSRLVAKLNENPADEGAVWEKYAKTVRKNAHSYREVIDSGLFHIGFLSSDGTLTELGYKYVEACERFGNAYAGLPMDILRAAVLDNGKYGAMLHYIHRISEERFKSELFAFAQRGRDGIYSFDVAAYLSWLDDEFANTLHLVKKSAERAGGTRKPFQAELAFLKQLGFVKSNGRSAAFRVGVGLEIDWAQMQNSMSYSASW